MRDGVDRRSRTWLVSVALPGLEQRQQHLVQSAVQLREFAGTAEWDLERLKRCEAFRGRARILDLLPDQRLGLWRPAVILEQLRLAADGDVVVYHDVGPGYWGDHAFRMSIAPVVDWAVTRNGGIMPGVWLPEDGRNARWTTRSCFRAMDCDDDRFWSTPQILATYSVWQRTDRTLDFVQSWLSACATVFGGGRCTEPAAANFPDFLDDRGTQSILTNLAVRREVACFGRPHETTAAITHPAFPRIPAHDIGNLCVRIIREQDPRRAMDPGSENFEQKRASSAEHPPDTKRRMALFTSIPPRLRRDAANGFPIGERYQAECIESWRRCDFEVYSIHYRDEMAALRRFDGVTYVEVERSEDDDPGEPKPSFRAILDVVRRSGVDVPGIINSDIMLLSAPGWTDVIGREITDSVIVVTRYNTNDVDRTCVGWAWWGFDLVFLDPSYIDRTQYCGMRIGECWWDYWLPLSMYFLGATVKHVEDLVALHHDHTVVSNDQIYPYGKRFFAWLAGMAEAENPHGRSNRLTEFYDHCQYRFAIEAARLGVPADHSYRFITQVLNPTVWGGICGIRRRNRLEVISKDHPHHRLLADLTLRTAQHVGPLNSEHLAARVVPGRMAFEYLAARNALADYEALERLAVAHARALSQSWSRRLDSWAGNVARRLRRKPKRPEPRIENLADAVAFIEGLDSRLIWSLAGPCRYARNLLVRRKHKASERQHRRRGHVRPQQAADSAAAGARLTPDGAA